MTDQSETDAGAAAPSNVAPNLQQRVAPWMLACFGAAIAADKVERRNRALEEMLELDQAAGGSREDAHLLVDYVHDRPIGEIAQEVGGVMLTLAAFCLAHDIDMQAAGDAELARVWTKIDQIRAKQAAKPRNSPLPAAPAASRFSQTEMLAFGQFCKDRGGWWGHTPAQLFSLFQQLQPVLSQAIETSDACECCVACERVIAENELAHHYRDGPITCRTCAPTLAEAIVGLQESIDCSEDDEDKAAWRESIAALQARIDAGEDPAAKYVW